MKVLVLGCGPAGLMAAHAAVMGGHDVMIMSKARKSYMRGAQYLHMPIPIASQRPPFKIKYMLNGTSVQYKYKVYGADPKVRVSPEDLNGEHDAWDIREAYDWLWAEYGHTVSNVAFTYGDAHTVRDLLNWAKPDYTISTIPATLLCDSGHSFTVESIWSNDLDVGISDNTVVCEGRPNPAWYRAAKILGHTTVEWPYDSRPPLPDLHEVKKPIMTNCDCFPDVFRMGRYGKWTKGVLSHEAFFETADLLGQPFQGRLL